MNYFKNLLLEKGVKEWIAGIIAIGIVIILILLLCVVVQLIVKRVVLKRLEDTIKKDKFKWNNIMLERKVFDRLSNIIPGIILFSFVSQFGSYQLLLRKLIVTYVMIVILFVVDALLNSINDIYKTFPVSKIRPIKSLLQIVKIIFYTIMGIFIIAILMEENPVVLLGGIGAIVAVVSFVFKDSILGFVAGIQLTTNNMLQIGDWIEMPKYGADGDVIEITVNTVKVQNFDKTIVTIPAYALVSDSFKNWRGMQTSGGRRIKRAINIDMTSIGFCTQEMLDRFRKIQYLSEYIKNKEKEIAHYNLINKVEDKSLANGRHMTNIGTFRAYILCYLKNHPDVNQDMTLMVRQLSPGEYGLPLEIYVFSSDIKWENYESIQADIFDHIIAVISEFGLKIYQHPTVFDLK